MFEWNYSKEIILLSRHLHCLDFTPFSSSQGRLSVLLTPPWSQACVWRRLWATWLGRGRCDMGSMEDPIDSGYTRAKGSVESKLERSKRWADLKLRGFGGQAGGGFAAHKLDAIVPSHDFHTAFCPVLSLLRLTATALAGSDWCSPVSSAAGSEWLSVSYCRKCCAILGDLDTSVATSSISFALDVHTQLIVI